MLEIIGALAVSGLLIYVTLGNLAVFTWSDYGIVDTIKWNWKDLWFWWAVNIALAGIWWLLVGSNINISIGVK